MVCNQLLVKTIITKETTTDKNQMTDQMISIIEYEKKLNQ